MKTKNYQLAVVGGGPAGMASALAAYHEGIEDIVIIERDFELGGILPQCIHNGFGLHHFNEDLTGPEYAHRYIDELEDIAIEVKLNTMVLEINEYKEILMVNRSEGLSRIKAEAVILAMGCRERTRGAIAIPGSRPEGIITAGSAQRLTNIEGLIPGRKAVILGSGDIGMIMARRMFLEGAEVEAVLEILPYTNGLTRNVVQCLDDFNIPLRLNQTIIEIKGKKRVESVIAAEVDADLKPIPGSEYEIECDTVILSVGLIPENELSEQLGLKLNQRTGGTYVNEKRETEIEGVFACGNVLHVHDLVDYVSEESQIAGRSAAEYIQIQSDKNRRKRKNASEKTVLKLKPGDNISYIIPNRISELSTAQDQIIYFRVKKPQNDLEIKLINNGHEVKSIKKRFVKPGEMNRIILDAEKLKALNRGELLISAE